MAARVVVCELALPWPVATVSANARDGWKAKMGAVARQRQIADGLMLEAGYAWALPAEERWWLELQVGLWMPDERRRDLDNIVGSLKGYLDGVFGWLGLDDADVRRLVVERAGLARPAGKVVLRIRRMRRASKRTAKARAPRGTKRLGGGARGGAGRPRLGKEASG